MQMWEGGPVPVQMWERVGPVPVQMWQQMSPVPVGSPAASSAPGPTGPLLPHRHRDWSGVASESSVTPYNSQYPYFR